MGRHFNLREKNMALKIRLRQQGRKNQQTYRLVLCDSRSPRDGKYIEILGWYNPRESEPEKNLNIQSDRVQHWLSRGAILTEKAETLVKRGAPEVISSYKKKQVEATAKANLKKKSRKRRESVATA
jgi:small subunit ribosomal protein S16